MIWYCCVFKVFQIYTKVFKGEIILCLGLAFKQFSKENHIDSFAKRLEEWKPLVLWKKEFWIKCQKYWILLVLHLLVPWYWQLVLAHCSSVSMTLTWREKKLFQSCLLHRSIIVNKSHDVLKYFINSKGFKNERYNVYIKENPTIAAQWPVAITL